MPSNPYQASWKRSSRRARLSIPASANIYWSWFRRRHYGSCSRFERVIWPSPKHHQLWGHHTEESQARNHRPSGRRRMLCCWPFEYSSSREKSLKETNIVDYSQSRYIFHQKWDEAFIIKILSGITIFEAPDAVARIQRAIEKYPVIWEENSTGVVKIPKEQWMYIDILPDEIEKKRKKVKCDFLESISISRGLIWDIRGRERERERRKERDNVHRCIYSSDSDFPPSFSI